MMNRPWMVSYDIKRFYYADHIIGTEYDEIIFILWFYTIVVLLLNPTIYLRIIICLLTQTYITDVLPNTFQFKG